MVKIITGKQCHNCNALKHILKARKLDNESKIVYEDVEDFGRDNLIQRGILQLPVLVLPNGEFVFGKSVPDLFETIRVTLEEV